MDNAGTVDSTSIGTEKPVAEEVDSVAAEPEVVKPEETKMEKSRAEKAYDELDGKQGAGVGESIPANVENAKGWRTLESTVQEQSQSRSCPISVRVRSRASWPTAELSLPLSGITRQRMPQTKVLTAKADTKIIGKRRRTARRSAV